MPKKLVKQIEDLEKQLKKARATLVREHLPATRDSMTHKFTIGKGEKEEKGYVIVGFFEDKRPGELFIKMAKEGSTIGGLMDTIGILTSVALQYGVPLKELVDKLAHTRFDPSGFTGNEDIPIAKSPVDYIFRWLDQQFGEKDINEEQLFEESVCGTTERKKQ